MRQHNVAETNLADYTIFDAGSIPRELRDVAQWIAWKPVQRAPKNGEVEVKVDKIPIDAKTGRNASSTDGTTWTDFDTAVAYAHEHGLGIGFVLCDKDPYVGVDVDDCITGGNINTVGQHILDTLCSYTEVSPSGNGLRIIVRGQHPGNRKQRNHIEMYHTGRFLTITGRRVIDAPRSIESNQEGLTAIYDEYLATKTTHAAEASNGAVVATGQVQDDFKAVREALERFHPWRADNYNEWVRVGHAIKHHFGDAGFGLWDEWSQQSPKYDAQDAATRWEKLSDDGELDIGTIFAIVKEDDPTHFRGTDIMPKLTFGQNQNGATVAAGQVEHRGTPTTDEYITALSNLGYEFRWNELDDTIEVNRQRINDGMTATIRAKMRDLGYTKVTVMEDAYTAHAYSNRYHPVKEYLNGLQWDGQNHIMKLSGYFKDDHPLIKYDNGTTPVISVWLGKWLIGAVAKVFGADLTKAQNPMLVLDGGQNLGKSVFVSWLASPLPDLFIESPINPDDKEHNRYLASKWIWEVAELGATTRKADREALKAFITKGEVTFRKPYDRHPVVKPALANFVGTINNEIGFLTDPTGSRRFLTARIVKLNWRYLDEVNIDQVWAQATALYQQGKTWLLTLPELEQRDAINGAYEVEDQYEGWILKYFDVDPKQTEWTATSSDIADRLQTFGMKATTRAIQMGIAGTLRKMGLTQDANARPRLWHGIREKPTPTSGLTPT